MRRILAVSLLLLVTLLNTGCVELKHVSHDTQIYHMMQSWDSPTSNDLTGVTYPTV